MKSKNIAVTLTFLILLAVISVASFIIPDIAVSRSERRKLTQFETYSEKINAAESKGEEYSLAKYFLYLEDYFLDQFPLRNSFRSLKALTNKYVFFEKDSNGYYLADNTLSKTDPELDYDALSGSIDKLNSVYEKYFALLGVNAFYALVPDKNYFEAEKNGYLHYDYDAFAEYVAQNLNDDFENIDLWSILEIGDYYRTDPHWSQEAIIPAADILLSAMGACKNDLASSQHFTENKLYPFYGTYYGQAALPVKPDTMTYLTSDVTDGATVYNYETGKEESVYSPDRFTDTDPYNVYLGGATPLLKITNPSQDNGKQLVIFRDSFGSSITPLLISAYSEIIVVDIRYVSSAFLGSLAEFKPGCDLLYLYSTSVLNSFGAFMN